MWKRVINFLNKIILFVQVRVRSSTFYWYLQLPMIQFFILDFLFLFCFFVLVPKIISIYDLSFHTFIVDNFYSKEVLMHLDKQKLLILVNYVIEGKYTLNNLREFDLYSLNKQIVEVIYKNHPKDYTNKPWRKAIYTENLLFTVWFREALHEVDPSIAIALDRRIEVILKRTFEESARVWQGADLLWEDYCKKNPLEKDMTKLWADFLKQQLDKQNTK